MSCPCPSSSPPPVCAPSGTVLSGMVRAFFGSQTDPGFCMEPGEKSVGATHPVSGMNIIQPLGKPNNCATFLNSLNTTIFTGSGEDFVIPDYSCRELVEAGVLPLWDYNPVNLGNGPYEDGGALYHS